MAKRRMISIDILDTGPFLQMSDKAKILWVYAVCHADDEGVVDMYPFMKELQCTSMDPLRELIEGNYIQRLSIGADLLAYVINWEDFNKIQQSRFVPSKHHELLVKVRTQGLPNELACIPSIEQTSQEDGANV